jgi:hypothetical protein
MSGSMIIDRTATEMTKGRAREFVIEKYFVQRVKVNLLITGWSNGSKYSFSTAILLETPWICFAKNDYPISFRRRMGHDGRLYQ